MIEKSSIENKTKKLSLINDFSDLDFTSKRIFREIDKATELSQKEKSNLRDKLNRKLESCESSLFKTNKSQIDNYFVETKNKLRYISIGDWNSLNKIESGVQGVNNKFSWYKSDLIGVSLPSAKKLIQEINSNKKELISIVNNKKEEFEDYEKKKIKEQKALDTMQRNREEVQKKLEEQERLRRLMGVS